MSDDRKQPEKESHTQRSHAFLWIAVTIFIILAIGGMWALDYYCAPDMIHENVLPNAAGK
jgi:hypothetical protein